MSDILQDNGNPDICDQTRLGAVDTPIVQRDFAAVWKGSLRLEDITEIGLVKDLVDWFTLELIFFQVKIFRADWFTSIRLEFKSARMKPSTTSSNTRSYCCSICLDF